MVIGIVLVALAVLGVGVIAEILRPGPNDDPETDRYDPTQDLILPDGDFDPLEGDLNDYPQQFVPPTMPAPTGWCRYFDPLIGMEVTAPAPMTELDCLFQHGGYLAPG